VDAGIFKGPVMTKRKPGYAGRANAGVFHRKRYASELMAVVVMGGVFGFLTSDYFLQFATIIPNSDPPIYATWKDTFFVWLSLFGVMIWPALFALAYFFWYRLADKKFLSKQEANDSQARLDRQAEVEERIAQAQANGDLDRWKDKS
jgi:hypothetical protein